MTTLDSQLVEFMKTAEVPWSKAVEDKLLQYRELLLFHNQSTNLIGPMDASAVDVRLIGDSLTAAATWAPEGSIIDVGSGGGLPGIPLKICYPDLPLTLVEPRNKRVQFLNTAVEELGLKDVTVVKSRIETSGVGPHDYTISKAFRAPADWLEVAKRITTRSGVIVCMHSPNAELLPAAQELGLDRIAYTETVKERFGAHEGDVRRSVSVFRRKAVD